MYIYIYIYVYIYIYIYIYIYTHISLSLSLSLSLSFSLCPGANLVKPKSGHQKATKPKKTDSFLHVCTYLGQHPIGTLASRVASCLSYECGHSGLCHII